ncbi:MAG: YicC family protein, partial [Hyphomicrobiales bacterium]
VALLSQLSEKVDAAPARLDGLLSLKGVVEFVEPEESDEERENLSSALLASLDDTLSGLVEMRASEGVKLEELLVGQLDEIERLSIAARDCPARTVEAIQTRLSEQVAKLIEASTTLDAERLHQEAVLIAAKADIQEELDRLFAHVEAARALLAGGEPVGRKFDFLTQEFNREANTLCSKSNDQALTAIGLDLKAVVDQMREQVQNVE